MAESSGPDCAPASVQAPGRSPHNSIPSSSGREAVHALAQPVLIHVPLSPPLTLRIALSQPHRGAGDFRTASPSKMAPLLSHTV